MRIFQIAEFICMATTISSFKHSHFIWIQIQFDFFFVLTSSISLFYFKSHVTIIYIFLFSLDQDRLFLHFFFLISFVFLHDKQKRNRCEKSNKYTISQSVDFHRRNGKNEANKIQSNKKEMCVSENAVHTEKKSIIGCAMLPLSSI